MEDVKTCCAYHLIQGAVENRRERGGGERRERGCRPGRKGGERGDVGRGGGGGEDGGDVGHGGKVDVAESRDVVEGREER